MDRDECLVHSTPIEDTLEGWDYSKDDAFSVPTREHIDQHTGEITQVPIEVDDDLGLELVHKPSIKEKYGIVLDTTTNSFHKSIQSFFDRNGYLTDKQLNCFK